MSETAFKAKGFTPTVLFDVAVQPSDEVIVIVYTVVEDGFAAGFKTEDDESPAAGDHAYVSDPLPA